MHTAHTHTILLDPYFDMMSSDLSGGSGDLYSNKEMSLGDTVLIGAAAVTSWLVSIDNLWDSSFRAVIATSPVVFTGYVGTPQRQKQEVKRRNRYKIPRPHPTPHILWIMVNY